MKEYRATKLKHKQILVKDIKASVAAVQNFDFRDFGNKIIISTQKLLQVDNQEFCDRIIANSKRIKYDDFFNTIIRYYRMGESHDSQPKSTRDVLVALGNRYDYCFGKVKTKYYQVIEDKYSDHRNFDEKYRGDDFNGFLQCEFQHFGINFDAFIQDNSNQFHCSKSSREMELVFQAIRTLEDIKLDIFQNEHEKYLNDINMMCDQIHDAKVQALGLASKPVLES